MAFAQVSGIKISGIVNILPKNTVYNSELYPKDSTHLQELIKHTGIISRRICNDQSQSVKSYAQFGINHLLEKLKWDSQSIDVLIFVTQSTHIPVPSYACQLHGELNLHPDTLCFDVNAGCSGYVYGLHTVYSILSGLSKKNARALLCCGDFSSRLIEKDDLSTQPIFSDAVSVTAIERDDDATDTFFHLQTDGSGKNAIFVDYPNEAKQPYMRLNGIDVFNYSVRLVPKHVNNLLEYAYLNTDEIDGFILHQANKLINDSICRSLKVTSEKAPETLSLYGNTASASIAITLAKNLELYPKPTKIVLCGFGVGFSIASAVVSIKDLYSSNIEL
jgi:3-oxoacyl-[acyl-carrier-protein] synthase-3